MGNRSRDVIDRPRSSECQFRRSKSGREELAPPNQGGTHVPYSSRERAGIGCVTSKPAGGITFFEQLAFELKCSVATAKKLYEQGLVN
jgi:hypothetical protein